MNHAQARAPLQNVTAMQSVYQYLLAQGLEDSVRMIEEESGIPLDEDALANSPGHLLTALSAYEDQRQMAFRIRQPDPEFQAITQWIVRQTRALTRKALGAQGQQQHCGNWC